MKSKTEILFSIVIPVRVETPYLKETLKKLDNQTLKSFEVLVITDEISLKSELTQHQVGPSFKRNLGAKMAKGKYLAFIDDDSYPSPQWLENSLKILTRDNNVSAVCGPCLTPPKDNLLKQASGLVWASWLGSGGAGTYRNSIQNERIVDDYPTVNLIVKKDDFWKVGGFNNNYWPGEDTILCLDLTHKLKKNILYHPSIVVYHHRRNVIIPHLQQITRYAIHRGYFVKKFPQTSLRLGYFIPSLFTIYTVLLILLNIYSPDIFTQWSTYFYMPIYLYLSLLFFTVLSFLLKTNNFLLSLAAGFTIPITHFYYGILFVYGLLQSKLNFTPHKIDIEKNKYVGG